MRQKRFCKRYDVQRRGIKYPAALPAAGRQSTKLDPQNMPEITPTGRLAGAAKIWKNPPTEPRPALLLVSEHFPNNTYQRNFHIQGAGRRYCTLVLDFSRSSPPAGNSRNFLPPPLAAPLGPFLANNGLSSILYRRLCNIRLNIWIKYW